VAVSVHLLSGGPVAVSDATAAALEVVSVQDPGGVTAVPPPPLTMLVCRSGTAIVPQFRGEQVVGFHIEASQQIEHRPL
jgi:hypothetical protein